MSLRFKADEFEIGFREAGLHFCRRVMALGITAYALFFLLAASNSDLHSETSTQVVRFFGIAVFCMTLFVFSKYPHHALCYYVVYAALTVIATWIVVVFITAKVAFEDPAQYSHLVSGSYLVLFCTYAFVRLPAKISLSIGVCASLCIVLIGAASIWQAADSRGVVGNLLREGAYLLMFNLMGLVLQRGTETRERKLFDVSRAYGESAAESTLRLAEVYRTQKRLRHDVQQPIGAIGLAIERLANPALSKQEWSKSIIFLRDCQKAALQTIEVLLGASLHDQNKVNLSSVSLAESIQTVLETLRPAARDRGVNLLVKFRNVKATTDSTRLLAILLNLVGNAIKYSDSIEGRVWVYVAKEEAGLLIIVADNGIGIPKEDQSRVFQDGYRAGNVQHAATGQGVGLHQVKLMLDPLERHRLKIMDRRGPGTRFLLRLPA